MNDSGTILVSEIFGPTVQGEGALIGRPTVFVRTGGCDYRCSWCDTLHAVEGRYRDEWREMSAEEILAQVNLLTKGRPLPISLSGGNPAIQPLGRLLTLGREAGYTFLLETQGSIAREWFVQLDILTLSPKPPSSGMTTDRQKLRACIDAAGNASVVLKLVILDEEDFTYARQVSAWFPQLPVYLQPCNPGPLAESAGGEMELQAMTARLRQLVDRVIAAGWYEARVLPQLHVLLWGQKRGV